MRWASRNRCPLPCFYGLAQMEAGLTAATGLTQLEIVSCDSLYLDDAWMQLTQLLPCWPLLKVREVTVCVWGMLLHPTLCYGCTRATRAAICSRHRRDCFNL